LERFGELTRKSTFGRKLTLFLTPYVMFSLKPEHGGDFEAVEGDGIVFWNRPRHLADKCRELLRPLAAEIGHEFQLHVHHENTTLATRESYQSGAVHQPSHHTRTRRASLRAVPAAVQANNDQRPGQVV